jgi:hypothetical protein
MKMQMRFFLHLATAYVATTCVAQSAIVSGEVLKVESKTAGESAIYKNARLTNADVRCLEALSNGVGEEANKSWQCLLVPEKGASVLRLSKYFLTDSLHPNVISFFVQGLDLSKSSTVMLPKQGVSWFILDMNGARNFDLGLPAYRLVSGRIVIDRQGSSNGMVSIQLELRYLPEQSYAAKRRARNVFLLAHDFVVRTE